MAVETKRFSLFNVDGKNNKFWNITLLESGDVEVHYGPQGGTGQRKTFPNAGRSYFEKKIREKTSAKHAGGAYVENQVLETAGMSSSSGPKVVDKHTLAQKAVNDIGASQPELKKLIQYFADVNAHNLYEASGGKITYDVSSGHFKTTQGVVTLDQVQQARALLDQIDGFAAKGDFDSAAFKAVLNPYLSLIPQKGLVRQMHFPSMFSPTGAGGLQQQNDILDSLESSYATVIANAQKANGKKDAPVQEATLFKVTMNLIEDGKIIDKIRRYYRESKGSHYDVANYDVCRAFNLDIRHMSERFDAQGKSIGNVMRLWHGTKAANMLSILKAGFVVPRSGGSIGVTGRMYGDGVYFSDMSTKAIRYATGAWGGGGGHDRKFMFLADVAMGKIYRPAHSFSGLPPKGYDSTFAEAGKSGVMNNEMIVYSLQQINPVNIIEFTIHGK
ncbi:MAG: hypothetical protein M0R80_08035 [Proteobacteria bacterium]|jgi:poly [ADP-ribose] polymerase|nr:hypothetical protein [Pseudomonadota bacterium]